MNSKNEFFVDSLHIFILFSLAGAQPLYVISRYAEFFIAHNAMPADVILLLLVPSLLIPAVLVFVEFLAGNIHGRFRKALHSVFVAGLLAVIVLIVLKKYAGGISGNVLVIGAVLSGVFITAAYIRVREVRRFLTLLLPAIFIFPYFFLFKTPVYKVVFPRVGPSAFEVKAEQSPPVVFVVFDEFPVTSLMDERRMIDPLRYPHFASLAGDSYWFRNATAVADNTTEAVPAILSGSYPERDDLPTSVDHPHNLFTLLGEIYDLKVTELITYLCPEQLCEKQTDSLQARMYAMFTDLSLVLLHILLPADVSYELPAVTQSWKGFADTAQKPKDPFRNVFYRFAGDAMKELEKDREEIFTQFIESIRPAPEPTLYFQHLYLPHSPWIYLPSGKKYRLTSKIHGLIDKRWGDEESFAIDAYQKHLLQVGFADTMLGKLIHRLKEEGLYDGSLIVITADHGISFRRNDYIRIITKTNYPDILPVPLFIKKPFQKEGMISDRNVETIDILPTIAHILGIPLPWEVDGQSALDASRPERKQKVMYGSGERKGERSVFEGTLDAKYHTLARKIAIFGDGTRKNGLFMQGPLKDSIGSGMRILTKLGDKDLAVTIDQENYFSDIDPQSSFIPAEITGSIATSSPGKGPLNLVISINDTIRAITQTVSMKKGEVRFSAVVPEESFRSGLNTVKVYHAFEERGQLHLVETRSEARITYTLEETVEGEKLLISSDGISIPVLPLALQGSLDLAEIRSNQVVFAGWSADVKNAQPPETIVVFKNKKFLFAGNTELERTDVAENLGIPELRNTGFWFELPASVVQDTEGVELRFFAVSKKGVATELHYPEGFQWAGD